MKKILFLLSLLISNVIFSQLTPDTKSSLYTLPDHTNITTSTTKLNNNIDSNRTKKMMAAPANDNYVNAQLMTINTLYSNYTTYQSTLEANEYTDCQGSDHVGLGMPAVNGTVWFKFIAGGAGTYYVNMDQTAARNVFGTWYLNGVSVWNSGGIPTTVNNPVPDCNAIQCQDAEDAFLGAPQTYSIQLKGLINGTTYYIQVGDNAATLDNGEKFNIEVSTAALYTVYNPDPSDYSFGIFSGAVPAPYVASCSPTTGQIFTAANEVQIPNPPFPTYPGYPAGSIEPGYVATLCFDFTIPAGTYSSIYATDGSGGFGCGGGNVYWEDWKLYTGAGSLITCGNSLNPQVQGLACNTTYILCNTFESSCDYINAWGPGAATGGAGDIYGLFPYASYYPGGGCPGASCTPLPITLTSFQVEYKQSTNQVIIYWTTATETNNKLFIIEKSIDGVNWEIVTTEPGAGNSTTILYYSAVDENPTPGTSYYRLKQTDYDGNYTYSSVIPMSLPITNSSFIVYPNPTTGNVTLRYLTQRSDNIKIVVSNLIGDILYTSQYQVKGGSNEFIIPTSVLSSGAYFIGVTNSEKTSFNKFFKN